MNNLQNNYLIKIIPNLIKHFNYNNIHQVPKLVKIVINSGLGLNAQNKIFLKKAIDEIRSISGQHPKITLAKKAIAGFKIRKGMPLGLYVTLRRKKMYYFLEKFITIVLPRLRDFRGLSKTNFDKFGNYNIGIVDQLIFPDIDFDTVDKKIGYNISIITTAKTINESFFLLNELGLPFVH
jgi:large subunit ribosomal protein L5